MVAENTFTPLKVMKGSLLCHMSAELIRHISILGPSVVTARTPLHRPTRRPRCCPPYLYAMRACAAPWLANALQSWRLLPLGGKGGQLGRERYSSVRTK